MPIPRPPLFPPDPSSLFPQTGPRSQDEDEHTPSAGPRCVAHSIRRPLARRAQAHQMGVQAVRRPGAHDVRGHEYTPLYYRYSSSSIASYPWTRAASRQSRDPSYSRTRSWRRWAGVVTSSAAAALQVSTTLPFNWSSSFLSIHDPSLSFPYSRRPQCLNWILCACLFCCRLAVTLIKWSVQFTFTSLAVTFTSSFSDQFSSRSSVQLLQTCSDSANGKWLQLQIYSSDLVINCRDLIF
jgi:hypothetical protein